MKSKYIITGLLLFPFLLFASITEQEIVDILGTDYHSEAAQNFIPVLWKGDIGTYYFTD